MSNNALLFILFFAACIGFGILWEIWRRKCPKCGKFFAREVTKNNVSHGTDYMHDHTHRTTVSDCRCKYCGHTWVQRYTSTKHK